MNEGDIIDACICHPYDVERRVHRPSCPADPWIEPTSRGAPDAVMQAAKALLDAEDHSLDVDEWLDALRDAVEAAEDGGAVG